MPTNARVPSVRWLGALLVLLVGPGAVAAADLGTSSDSGIADRISALTVFGKGTPPLRVPHYRTSGAYPQVSGGNLDLGRVNDALRDAVLAEQHRFAPIALKDEAQAVDSIRLGYKGLFATSTVLRLMSASTVVVSSLVPVDEVFPGGHEAGFWLSVTVRVPSGSPVRLVDLFTRPALGLHALSAAVRNRVLSGNDCVREGLKLPGGTRYARGFAPTVENYRHFALTAGGLTVGFPIEQVASQFCNRAEATVPYTVLGPYWSTLGKTLIAGVRPPK